MVVYPRKMSIASEPRWTLRVKNLRALRDVEWSPGSVSCVVGPNGAGKTTLLECLRFLRNLLGNSRSEALAAFRMASTQLLRLGTEVPIVELGLDLEHPGGPTSWRLKLPVESGGVHPLHGETLSLGDTDLIRVNPFEPTWENRARDERSCLRMLWDHRRPPEMQPIVDFLEGLRIHRDYWLNMVGEGKAAVPGVQSYLHPTGANLAHVLTTWRSAPSKFGHRFEWVREHARRAFPDVLAELEFEPAGGFVLGSVISPNSPEEPLPFGLAADGLLTGLLHLTAVAGMEPGNVVAIDEMETHLHPHAIRSVLSSMRERAEEHGLNVVLTTQSPVVLDEFDDCPERLFVLERDGEGPAPTPVTQLRDEQWLANFSLGELYERQDFGTPDTTKAG